MTGERILVVDDEPKVVQLCTKMLSKDGYDAQGLTSGVEAIRLLEAEAFDLLIVDIKMPDVDGLTVLRRGRELQPDLMAVVITGYATLDSAVEALHAGAHRFVLKPFSSQEFTMAIQQALAYKQREEERQRLRAQLPILEIAQALMEEGDVDLVSRRLLEVVVRDLGVDQAALLLLDGRTDDLYLACTFGLPAEFAQGVRLPAVQGLIRQILPQAGPVVFHDTSGWPTSWQPFWERLSFHTAVWVPLRTLKQFVGGLYLGRVAEDSSFTPSEIRLLAIVGGQMATAVENARLYAATQARVAELSLLNQMSMALTSTLDPSQVVEEALLRLQQLFHAENVSLLQPDPQTGELRFVRALLGPEPVEIPVCIPPGEGIAGWVLAQRQPVLVEDATEDPRFFDQVDAYLGSQTRSLISVPLFTPERDIGVIEVISDRPDAFTHNELRTLQSLASTLAVALENARLYHELKELLREREQAQAQLVQSEKMAALGRLAASLAHEVNNPLQAIQTRLTLAQEEVRGQQRREKLERHLSIAEGEIERISNIVRRMRDFYRPAREEFLPTDLHAVLSGVLELSGKQLQHAGIVVQSEWDDKLPLVQVNPDHLKQVFLNLVLNAVDAMPAGGTLQVRTILDQLQTQAGPQPAVRIEFSDTGEGIPAEALPHIFEPFFTVKKHGVGLGLAISYGIIQAHKGQIQVSSREGHGSTFTILLPVDMPPPEPEL